MTPEDALRWKVIRQELWYELIGSCDASQWIIVDRFPSGARECLRVGRPEGIQLSVALESQLQVRQFFLFRIAGPLKHLPVQDGRNRRCCTGGELLRAKVQHDDGDGLMRGERS